MLSDKINRLPISRVDSPTINSFDEQNAVILINKQGNILSFEHSRRNSGVDRDRYENSPTTASPSKPVAYNPNSVTPEVEKRRAELAALARAAEAKAKEAEKQCEQAEGRLEQELRDRMLAEQRLRELEENRQRQLRTAAPIQEPPSRTAAWAQGGTAARQKESEAQTKGVEARAKEAAARAKESETEIQTLMVALMEAEQKRAKAETLAQVAREKAREFESQVETAKVALAEVNLKMAEAEAATRVAEEKSRTIESLLAEAESAGRQATERSQHIEAELEYEAKQRAAAERKLKEFEDELSSYLELDWSKGEPDLTQAIVARGGGGADEAVSQFQAQIEAERRARRESDDARAALELKTREMEKALRIAEENNRQIAALNLVKSTESDQTYTVKKPKGFKHELRFIVYGMAIMMLLITLVALIATVFLQI